MRLATFMALFGGGPSAGFVGATHGTTTVGALSAPVPAGTSNGDLILALFTFTGGSPPVLSGNAPSWSGAVAGYSYYSVGIATGNANVSITGPNGAQSYMLLVFRGALAATLKTTVQTTAPGSTVNGTGFTKNIGCKGIVTSCDQYDPTATPATTYPGFSALTTAVGGGATLGAAYLVIPAAYTSGAAIPWSVKASGSLSTDVLVFELT